VKARKPTIESLAKGLANLALFTNELDSTVAAEFERIDSELETLSARLEALGKDVLDNRSAALTSAKQQRAYIDVQSDWLSLRIARFERFEDRGLFGRLCWLVLGK
jgi:translation initiation factor 6 (eIF-6)